MTINAVEKCQRLVTLAKKVFQMKMGIISMVDDFNEIFKIEGIGGRYAISSIQSKRMHVWVLAHNHY